MVAAAGLHRKAGDEVKRRRRQRRVKAAVALRRAFGEGKVRTGKAAVVRCWRRGRWHQRELGGSAKGSGVKLGGGG